MSESVFPILCYFIHQLQQPRDTEITATSLSPNSTSKALPAGSVLGPLDPTHFMDHDVHRLLPSTSHCFDVYAPLNPKFISCPCFTTQWLLNTILLSSLVLNDSPLLLEYQKSLYMTYRCGVWHLSLFSPSAVPQQSSSLFNPTCTCFRSSELLCCFLLHTCRFLYQKSFSSESAQLTPAFSFFFSFVFLGLHPRHMEVPS